MASCRWSETDRARAGRCSRRRHASPRSSCSPSRSWSPALFVVLAGADEAVNETAETPLLGRPGARRRRRARRRTTVRPRPPQGQLGGAQLLHVRLRAVRAGAPRARRASPSSSGARAPTAPSSTPSSTTTTGDGSRSSSPSRAATGRSCTTTTGRSPSPSACPRCRRRGSSIPTASCAAGPSPRVTAELPRRPAAAAAGAVVRVTAATGAQAAGRDGSRSLLVVVGLPRRRRRRDRRARRRPSERIDDLAQPRRLPGVRRRERVRVAEQRVRSTSATRSPSGSTRAS